MPVRLRERSCGEADEFADGEYEELWRMQMKNMDWHRWFRELFFVRGVELTYDASSGEYGLRCVYRCRIPMDKFNYREYGTIMPIKKMFIAHKDFIRIADELPRFLSVHERIGKAGAV